MSMHRNRIPALSARRQALALLGTLGTSTLLGCLGSNDSSGDGSTSGASTTSTTTGSTATGSTTTGSTTTGSTTTGSTTTGSTTAAGSCVLIPQETVGPYPLDLSANPAFFRQDITEGKTGVPLTLTLNLVNTYASCGPIANARVDVWHCDKDGLYSGYNQSGANTVGQTFCRGIQLSDANGAVKFTTIYPGWYPGRITHIHFQVYLNNGLVATSQVAFPEDITRAVYATALYAARGQNTSVTSFAMDNVFSDGTQYQMCTISANAATGGYDATLNVGIIA